jgi:hypothetical protein
VKQSANSKQKSRSPSWFSDARVFVRRPDVASHQLGEFCNLFTLEVAGRAAGDLKAEAVRSEVWRAD